MIVYLVGQLSNQSTRLCNQTVTQWCQPAGLYSQPASLPVCLSVASSICLTAHLYLFNSLSLALPASLSDYWHVWCWQTIIILGLLFRLDGSTVKRHTMVLENRNSVLFITITLLHRLDGGESLVLVLWQHLRFVPNDKGAWHAVNLFNSNIQPSPLPQPCFNRALKSTSDTIQTGKQMGSFIQMSQCKKSC